MDNKSLSVIDTATNNVIGTVNVGFDPLGVVVNSAGTEIYVANEDGTVSIIDTSTNKVTATVKVGGYPYGIAVTPDGKKIYVADRNSNNVYVIETATNKVTDTVEVGEGAVGVAVTPDGTKAYVTNLYSKNVSVIDTATNKIIKTVCIGDYPTGVTVNPDGTKVYVVNANQFADNDFKSEDGLIIIMSGDEPIGTVSVIDTATNKVTAKVRVGISPSGVAVNPTGTKAYVANYNSNNVSIIDTSTNKVIDTVEVGERPVGVAVTPDGTKVYVANEGSNNVSVIDTATNSVIHTVNVGKSPIAFGQFMGGKSVLLASNFSDNVTQVINEITEVDNGKTICLRNGDIFYLGLPENPTTGYSWELNLSQGLVLLSEKSILTDLPLSTQEVGICGMGDFHLWKIKANSGGSYYIKGVYARFWEPDPAETYIVNLTVTNEKHCRS